jgi:hypothetical protein
LVVYQGDSGQAQIQFQNVTTGSVAGDGFGVGLDSSEKGFIWNYEGNDTYIGGAGGTSITIQNGGNVGIGTTGPSALLDLETAGNTLDGSYYSTMTINNTGSSTYSGVRFDRSGASRWRVGLMPDDTFQIAKLYNTVDDGAFVIDSNGKVGIGTSSPDTSLHIVKNQSSANSSIKLENAAGGNNSSFSIDWQLASSGTSAQIKADRTNSPGAGDTDLIFSTSTNGTTLSEAMRIKNTGNVGIGTTSPGAALHVDPAANVTTGFGTPLIKVGGDNSWAGNNSVYSVGFGYVDNSITNKSPAEIGIRTMTNAGYTKGDLVFATRDTTNNVAPTERMRIASNGDMVYGGGYNGVHEKYFYGITTGNTSLSHDIVHANDVNTGTVLHIQATMTHHPSYDCILDTWVSRRSSTFSHAEQFRRDTSLSGSWTVSYVSATVTRITKNAGSYGGGGPYWIKAVWKNYD